jgi:hypothetical protein
MWTAHCEHLADGGGVRLAVALDGRLATFADVVQGWQGDADFRSVFNATLADTPFSAFRWETPGVSAATITQPFQCVLLDSPGLARPPEPGSARLGPACRGCTCGLMTSPSITATRRTGNNESRWKSSRLYDTAAFATADFTK